MKKVKPQNRIALDPRKTLALVASAGYRKAAEQLKCSPGKLYGLRKAHPKLYVALRNAVTMPGGSTRLMPTSPSDNLSDVPTVWQEAAMYSRIVLVNKQEAVMIKLKLGFSLLRVKHDLPHGEFLPQLPIYCSGAVRSAERFMLLAEHVVPEEGRKFDTVSNFDKLPVDILAQVKTTVGSKSISQLYEEFGITTKKPKQQMLPMATAPMSPQSEHLSDDELVTSLVRLEARLDDLKPKVPSDRDVRFKEVSAAFQEAKATIKSVLQFLEESERPSGAAATAP